MNNKIMLFVLFFPFMLSAQEIIWQQEYDAMLNGDLTCAYSGGFDYGKPTFVDIDNDMDLDLFIGEREGGVDFYRNVGTVNKARWQREIRNVFSGNHSYWAPSFCDIDNDGDQDAFVGCWAGTIAFYQNDGTATSPIWNLITDKFEQIDVGYHSTPVFCDLDMDNDFDLTVGASDSIIVFENTGNENQHQFIRDSAIFDEDLHIIRYFDFDADGDFDRVVGAGYNFLFYENTGQNQYILLDRTDIITLPDNLYDLAMDFGDLDNDNDFDLVVFNTNSGSLYFENTGSVSQMKFEQKNPYYMSIDVGHPNYPALADLDSDGDLDLFCGAYYSGVYKITNIGTRLVPEWSLSGAKLVSDGDIPAFCDIDNDQDLDLFCGTQDGKITYYENTGTVSHPVFGDPIYNYENMSNPDHFYPAFCDIDNDGDFDFFSGWGDGQISYFQNTGTAASPAWDEPDTAYADVQTDRIRNAPFFHDIDKDGDFDLFVGTYSGEIFYYRNDGTPTNADFNLVTDKFGQIDIGISALPVFADIDSDGDADLFVGEDDGGINFFRNVGKTTEKEIRNSKQRVSQYFSLDQNYPNPFNPATRIMYHLPKPTHITLKIYNIQGQEIATLVDEFQCEGMKSIIWNGMDSKGKYVSTGIYLYRLEAGDFSQSKKMILL